MHLEWSSPDITSPPPSPVASQQTIIPLLESKGRLNQRKCSVGSDLGISQLSIYTFPIEILTPPELVSMASSFPASRHARSSSVSKISSSFPNKNYDCNTCGKKYKHPNCLSKHKWEHTKAWKETTKLALSKHQQVQLLEAAAILVGFVEESNHSDHEEMFEADD